MSKSNMAVGKESLTFSMINEIDEIQRKESLAKGDNPIAERAVAGVSALAAATILIAEGIGDAFSRERALAKFTGTVRQFDAEIGSKALEGAKMLLWSPKPFAQAALAGLSALFEHDKK